MKPKFKQRLQYTTCLRQGETPEAIFNDLINLLQTAETYSDQSNYQQALDIYAQVIDTRLATNEVLLTSLFDRAITQFLPQLDMLLIAASSLIILESSEVSNIPKVPDPSTPIASPSPIPMTISPLLNLEARRHWLERLFALWLKRIDIPPIGEQLQEIIFEVVWIEDIPYLRNLIESELQATSSDTHMYIGSFANQPYTRSLEQFLKQLP
jgi:hypothetical protein